MISKHGVWPDEVEDVIFNNRPYGNLIGKVANTNERRYKVLGKTTKGRYLAIILGKRERSGDATPITAWDMDNKDRRLYRNKLGKR